MGSQSRKLKQTTPKSFKLSDGKPLFGRGRLTDKTVNTFQNFYGMAIRQNKGNLYQMKKTIGAILHHCSDIDDPENATFIVYVRLTQSVNIGVSF